METGTVVMLGIVLIIVMAAIGVLIATVKKKKPECENTANHS